MLQMDDSRQTKTRAPKHDLILFFFFFFFYFFFCVQQFPLPQNTALTVVTGVISVVIRMATVSAPSELLLSTRLLMESRCVCVRFRHSFI